MLTAVSPEIKLNRTKVLLCEKYQKIAHEKHIEREQEKQRAAEKGLSLIEIIILDDEELNFMKQVLIEVLKQNK